MKAKAEREKTIESDYPRFISKSKLEVDATGEPDSQVTAPDNR
jgi:hypothetical protein